MGRSASDAAPAAAGVWRAESSIARILAPVVAVHGAVETVEAAVSWRSMTLPWFAVVTPLLALCYSVWLVSRIRSPGRRSVDAVVLLTMVVVGSVTEVFGQPVWMTVSMQNVGFTITTAALYATPRAGRSVGATVVGVGTLAHLLAARTHPVEAWQGAVLCVAIWAVTQRVALELRRAGRDADGWRRLAQEAEHVEAQARVHDAQGLLRVVRSHGGGDLAGAVEATRRRNARWFADEAKPNGGRGGLTAEIAGGSSPTGWCTACRRVIPC